MERLPHDIYDEICAYIGRTSYNRPALATVSRQWQYAVERLTFEELCLKSSELDTFELIAQGSRRRLIRRLNFIVVLPSYGDDVRCKFETAADRSTNDQAFTAAFTQLFDMLQTWNPREVGTIEFTLKDIYSVSDHPFIRMSDPSLDTHKALMLVDRDADRKVIDLWSFRFGYSYIRFTEGHTLPAVSAISSFMAGNAITRHLADQTLAEILGRLPNLDKATMIVNDGCVQYIGLRRSLRADFAAAIKRDLPRCRHLRSLRILTTAHTIWTPDSAKDSLADRTDPALEGQSPDALSTAIRLATLEMPRLEELSVRGFIDCSLFMPPGQTLAPRSWPNLRHLRVSFRNRRPEGGHYLYHNDLQAVAMPSEDEIPPGYPATVESNESAVLPEQFNPITYHGHLREFNGADELVPDHDAVEALFTAFAKTCQRLPRLQFASLSTAVPSPVAKRNETRKEKEAWGMWYLSPGIKDINIISDIGEEEFDQALHQHRVYCKTGGWMPSQGFERLMSCMGGDRCEKVVILPVA
ncbi:hypothetical protein Micbo1qcDRAFT_167460 [Microdochium bolleyi]|uniref:F-box domain-containing protein n=1 Tax=Microdochium bolleyi TaxID=196109 RepID=A0A136IRB8_9PEZI|nr:hypothetical protein Micbo1qcDRAFT_167460 [Microdochium bolleyi]